MTLNKQEQDVMAQICAVISSFVLEDNHDDKALLRMAEDIMAASEGCSSQFFGKLYDKFHRTGTNL